jgi:hypothetical protein
MELARIQSKVLYTAKQELPVLNMYLSIFKTEQDCFITEVKDNTTQLRAVIDDYCFNEKESKKMWDIAEKIRGTRAIDLKVIKTVEI